MATKKTDSRKPTQNEFTAKLEEASGRSTVRDISQTKKHATCLLG